jgi:ubiquinone biosynthesis monooxygenase Coq7
MTSRNNRTDRHLSGLDRAILRLDRLLQTLVPGTARATRPTPGDSADPIDLDDAARKHVAGLMRINHTGEVCAQGLYQGQALTARLDDVRDAMSAAAAEEVDHLAWCEQRLRELDSRPSLLNPLFYGASFAIGAAAGAVGDKWSLGFVAATEEQVCRHLESHLLQLPADDQRNRAVLEEMLVDEARHGTAAMAAGGAKFPGWLKRAMTAASKVMTATTYRI